MDYKERPLPATPPLPYRSPQRHNSTPPIPNTSPHRAMSTSPIQNPSPQLYKLVRDSSIYNNPPPSPVPDYLDPDPIKPPDACPGVHKGRKLGTRRPLGQIQKNETVNPQGNPGNPDENGPPRVLPYYNSFKPELKRPISTVSSSVGYGALLTFQNQDVLDEMVEADESESNSPTYINAEAELGFNFAPISPDHHDLDYGQVPMFENPEVLDDVTADDLNSIQTDSVKQREDTYVNYAEPDLTSKNNLQKPPEFSSGMDTVNRESHESEGPDNEESRIQYINTPPGQDTRPISTVSMEPDYGPVPVFENEVFL